MNSRNIIALTIQAFITTFNCKKARKIPIIRILSAIGSSNLPKSETKFFFLAKIPSKKSVKEAKIKIRNAIRREEKVFIKINPIQIKAKIIRKKVR
jgi:hypothetical protein